jgi:uncharacterized protein (TIGR02246 family)
MTEAESDLRRLIAEYCHRYDDGKAAAFAALFAKDATFTVFGTSHVGRDEIRDTLVFLGDPVPEGA